MKYHEWNFCTKDENYEKLIVVIQAKKLDFRKALRAPPAVTWLTVYRRLTVGCSADLTFLCTVKIFRFVEQVFDYEIGWNSATHQEKSYLVALDPWYRFENPLTSQTRRKSINFMNKKWQKWHVNACSQRFFYKFWWEFVA